MKLIKGFEIDTSDMSAVAQTRSIRVHGDEGAVFNIRVTTPTKFYNFKSESFVSVETSECVLSNTVLVGSSFVKNIFFPADADGETYTVELFAISHFDTKISELLFTDLVYNSIRVAKSITQVADIVVTFQSKPSTTANFTSGTHSQTVTATQSPTVLTPLTVDIDWTFENAATDAKGFGFVPVLSLRPDDTISDASLGSFTTVDESLWYSGTTAVIEDTVSDDGGGSSHFNYKVDSIADLATGMTVTAVSPGSLSGTPTLSRVRIYKPTAVFPNRPFVKFSAGQVLANGATLTLRGYGSNSINKAINTDIEIPTMTLTQTPLTKTVRAAVDASTTVTLNGTYGVSKGAYLEGFGMDNSADNPITEISTASSSAGALVVTREQTLAAGTKLNVIGSSNSYTVKGSITINKFPTSNATIFLDLDKLLTLGTAS